MSKQKQILNFTDFIKNSQVIHVLKILENAGYQAFIVGGAVRDMLLNKNPYDFDLATNAKPKDVKRLFPKHLNQGERFGTIKVLVDENQEFEITTYRSEDVYSDARHPDFIKFATNPKEDSLRRDFTINAIYLDKEGFLFDPQNGAEDINQRLIRTVGDPNERFAEDALRVLRCFRFASQLGFKLDLETKTAAIEHWTGLSKVSGHRLYTEIKKMISGDFYSQVLPLLIEEKLLDDFVKSEPNTIQIDYLLNRAQNYNNKDLAFVFFLLDMASFQKNMEAYINMWKEVLPLKKEDKLGLENGLFFLKVLKSKVVQNKKTSIGHILRQGLDFLDLKDLKIFVSDSLLIHFDVHENQRVNILKHLKELEFAPKKIIKASDLMDLGIAVGPKLRSGLELAYEFQLEQPGLKKEQLIEKIKLALR